MVVEVAQEDKWALLLNMVSDATVEETPDVVLALAQICLALLTEQAFTKPLLVVSVPILAKADLFEPVLFIIHRLVEQLGNDMRIEQLIVVMTKRAVHLCANIVNHASESHTRAC